MTPNEFFARLAEARFIPKLRGVRATLGYRIEGAGTWHVTVQDGTIRMPRKAKNALAPAIHRMRLDSSPAVRAELARCYRATQTGTIRVGDGEGPAESIMSGEAADFVEILLGDRNLITALMQGRLSYRGPVAHLPGHSLILSLGPTLEHPAIGASPEGGVHP